MTTIRTSRLVAMAIGIMALLVAMVVITSLTVAHDCQQQQQQQQQQHDAMQHPNVKRRNHETTTGPNNNNYVRLIRPPPRADNLTLALCACMREEEPVVEEWVDFYLGIGVAHIHIYDNTEGFDLEQWAQERHDIYNDPITMTHVPEHTAVQRRVYRQCAEYMRDLGHDYVLFADVDEFLVIRNRTKYPHPVDLLLEVAPQGAMAVETMVFGSAGRQSYQPIPVTKRFQYKTDDAFRMNKKTKSMVHLGSFNWNKTHFESPHYPPIITSETSKIIWVARRKVLLYHYQFKSHTEFVRKYQKGSAWYGTRKGLDQARNGTTSQGEPIPTGRRFDDTAWQLLKQVAPRYAVYDQFYDHPPPFAPTG